MTSELVKNLLFKEIAYLKAPPDIWKNPIGKFINVILLINKFHSNS